MSRLHVDVAIDSHWFGKVTVIDGPHIPKGICELCYCGTWVRLAKTKHFQNQRLCTLMALQNHDYKHVCFSTVTVDMIQKRSKTNTLQPIIKPLSMNLTCTLWVELISLSCISDDRPKLIIGLINATFIRLSRSTIIR